MPNPVGYKLTATDAGLSTIQFVVSLAAAMDFATSGGVAWASNLPAPLAPFVPEKLQLDQWAPTDIAGCRLWLDADSGVTIDGATGNVSSWTDQSGTGLVLTAPAAARQPSLVAAAIGPGSALQFTAATDADPNSSVLTGPGFTGTDAAMAFIVAQETSGMATLTASTMLADTNTPSSRLSIASSFAGGYVWQIEVTTPLQGSAIDTDPHVFCADYSAGNLYIDHALDAGPSSVGTSTWDGIVVGGDPAATSYGFNGYIAEVIVFDSILSSSDRLLVESYLASRYDVTLT